MAQLDQIRPTFSATPNQLVFVIAYRERRAKELTEARQESWAAKVKKELKTASASQPREKKLPLTKEQLAGLRALGLA
jgi:hypothetical protein